MSDIRTDTTGIDRVDVRGPRFAAWLTAVVLAGVIVLSAASIPAAVALLAAQAVAFAIGATRRPRRHPYGLVYAKLVAPASVPSPNANRYRRCGSLNSWDSSSP